MSRQRKQSKATQSSGVEALLDQIHKDRMDRAHAAGMAWCGRRQHADRTPGQTCNRCVHQDILRESFWHSIGVTDIDDMP